MDPSAAKRIKDLCLIAWMSTQWIAGFCHFMIGVMATVDVMRGDYETAWGWQVCLLKTLLALYLLYALVTSVIVGGAMDAHRSLIGHLNASADDAAGIRAVTTCSVACLLLVMIHKMEMHAWELADTALPGMAIIQMVLPAGTFFVLTVYQCQKAQVDEGGMPGHLYNRNGKKSRTG